MFQAEAKRKEHHVTSLKSSKEHRAGEQGTNTGREVGRRAVEAADGEGLKCCWRAFGFY